MTEFPTSKILRISHKFAFRQSGSQKSRCVCFSKKREE